ncbi:MAG: hypothetical protein WC551_10020 [Patescibacteria group bacterium]
MPVSRSALEKIAAELSPWSGEGFSFSFKDWAYKVTLPTRAELSRARKAIALAIIGDAHASMAGGKGGNWAEGFLAEAEAHLALILVEAPEHWRKDGGLNLARVSEDELGLVWQKVVEHWPWLTAYSFYTTPEDDYPKA